MQKWPSERRQGTRAEVGRVAKNCTQVKVLLRQNNMTQVKVKSSHPNNYLRKSKKVLCEKTTSTELLE